MSHVTHQGSSLPVDARTGWPVNLNAPGAGFHYTPTPYDADHDGADEIFLTGGHTFALRGDGSNLPGFPQQAPDDLSNALDVPFVLGDVDGDEDLEAWGPHSRGNNWCRSAGLAARAARLA